MGEVPSVSIPCPFSLFPGCSLCLKCPSLTSPHCLGPSPTVTSTRKLSRCPSSTYGLSFTSVLPGLSLITLDCVTCFLAISFWGIRDPNYLVYTAALVFSMGPGTW